VVPASDDPEPINRSYLSERAAADANSGTAMGTDIKEASAEKSSTLVQLSDSGRGPAFVRKEVKQLEVIQNSNDAADMDIGELRRLSDKALVAVSTEEMAFSEFLHYVFGQILGVNYVLDPAVLSSPEPPVTLSVRDKLSEQRVFELSVKLLEQRDLEVNYQDGIYFVGRADGASADRKVVLAVGNTASDVPNTGSKILQMVPLRFGIRIHISQLLTELVSAKVTPNFQTNTIMIEGDRQEILRALDIIKTLDIPSAKGRHIGLIELIYTQPASLAVDVAKLLQAEGMGVSVGNASEKDGIALLPLESLGAVAVFATSQEQLDRVNYWLSLLDVPGTGTEENYFVYSPENTRAADLVESISSLLGLGLPSSNSNAGQTTGNAPSGARQAIGGDGIKVAVDERSNNLIFVTTAARFNSLRPLLQRLDVLPKQIMLDILIAEVTLKDEFKHGVEWAWQRGEVSLTTQGAFGASGVGGIGMLINGNEGPVTANFIGTNSLVNVISNPTLMILDGHDASITVGSSLSVTGQTTQDPISGQRQTTTSEYRDTGLSVSVTPEVTSDTGVMLTISQSISNALPGVGAGANPDIFTRDLNTVVIAQSGESILLGGLISESASDGGSGAPGLSKIPFLGNLFKARSRGKDRSELIMVVTAKIMSDPKAWQRVKEDFYRQLQGLKPPMSGE
jgi:general secretion pathway protein D